METELATDELTDSIAHIEMRRQDTVKIGTQGNV